LLGLLPALVERDLRSFGEALERIQADVGALFAPVQGGAFADPRSAALVELLRTSGLVGVGQSSWGPTLYGFTDAPADARSSILERLLAYPDRPAFVALWTRASRSGAHFQARR
jgi:predicted sugar kinase